MHIRSTIYLAAFSLLAGAVPAQAMQAGNGTAPAQTPAKAAASQKASSGEEKICRRPDTSGTRVIDKICLTKEEWKKVDAEG